MKRTLIVVMVVALALLAGFVIARADVPRGDLYHHPGVLLLNHPCPSIEAHLKNHEQDLYLGGECEFDDDDDYPVLDKRYFLPFVASNEPHECWTPTCIPFIVGEE